MTTIFSRPFVEGQGVRENDELELSEGSTLLDAIQPATSPVSHSLMGIDVFELERSFYLDRVKPLIDFVFGLLALVVAAPLLLVIAVVLRIRMGPPVVLRQRRMGRLNVPFTLYKFRTMEPDQRTSQIAFVGHDRRVTHKSASDPRITDLGRWLRATRLDELPQLFNVVRGELSLVGPRPELVSVVHQEYEPWQHRRHAVKPGLTGIWQIADRGDKRLHECTEYELAYLDTVSMATDLRIMCQTVPALFRRDGI